MARPYVILLVPNVEEANIILRYVQKYVYKYLYIYN